MTEGLNDKVVKLVYILDIRRRGVKGYVYHDPDEENKARRQRYLAKTVDNFICRMQIIILKQAIKALRRRTNAQPN